MDSDCLFNLFQFFAFSPRGEAQGHPQANDTFVLCLLGRDPIPYLELAYYLDVVADHHERGERV